MRQKERVLETGTDAKRVMVKGKAQRKENDAEKKRKRNRREIENALTTGRREARDHHVGSE